jgi:hypothetical protein
MAENLPPIHNVVLPISKSGQPVEGAISNAQADDILAGYVAKGYKLFGTHYIDQNPAAYHVLYVFVLG